MVDNKNQNAGDDMDGRINANNVTEQASEQTLPTERQKESSESGPCPLCGGPDGQKHSCTVCGKIFCVKCPGDHSPPKAPTFESKVHFMYRVKGSPGPWKEDMVRFSDNVPSPLCSTCWENECTKMIWRFKNKIKNWKQDLLREEDLKVLNETLPACGIRSKPDETVVKTALEFLAELQKSGGNQS